MDICIEYLLQNIRKFIHFNVYLFQTANLAFVVVAYVKFLKNFNLVDDEQYPGELLQQNTAKQYTDEQRGTNKLYLFVGTSNIHVYVSFVPFCLIWSFGMWLL